VRLLKAYEKVKKWHLQGPVSHLFRSTQKKMEEQFLSGNGLSLKKFNFYKLGTFIEKLSKTTPR
jgi:hypothetical protein